MTNPTVSAVMIFYNAERFIAESIESLLAQDYSPLEVILVDDGSTDASARIAKVYVGRHKDRVKLVQHPGGSNQGMSASRNLGVHHCRGEFIAFLDADDLWLPQKTTAQVAQLIDHPRAQMVYGRTQIWHSWQGSSARHTDMFCELGVEPNQIYDPPQLFELLLNNRAQTPTTCNAMLRREAYEQLGGFEDSFRGLYEDQAFFAKLHLRFPTFVSDQYWARYRQHAAKTNDTFSFLAYYTERRQFIEWLARYCDGINSHLNSQVRKLVVKELWRVRHPYLAALHARWLNRVQRGGV